MNPRSIVEGAFEATANGDGRAFVAMLAADARWTIIGTTDWSRTFEGKRHIVEELLGPLSAQFDGPNVVTAHRIIDAGHIIVVEGRNHSTTRSGEGYPNRYCWLFTFRGNEVVDIVEYCDTALVERVLEYPIPTGVPA